MLTSLASQGMFVQFWFVFLAFSEANLLFAGLKMGRRRRTARSGAGAKRRNDSRVVEAA